MSEPHKQIPIRLAEARKAATNQTMALSIARLPYHPALEERFGVDKSNWIALVNAIFPNASSTDSVILALSYCRARKLDPFKRNVHIVPIWDKNRKCMVDTIWPGIGELRTTAFRTGEYCGRDETAFGPDIIEGTVGKINMTYPEWARVTVRRMVKGQPVSFAGPKVYWIETYATAGRDDESPNQMWKERPRGQLEKCAEAAALRAAFPEEVGSDHIADEVQHQTPIQGLTEIDTAPARGVQAVKAKLAERRSDHATVGTAHYDEKTGFTLDNDAAKAGEHQGSAPAPANPRDELPPQADGRYKDNLTTDTSESQAPQNAAEEQEKAYNSPEPTIAEQLGIQMAEVSDDAGFFAVCLAAARQTHADITLEVVKPAMEQYCKLKMSKKGPPHTLSREGKARLLKELLGGTFKFE